MSPFGFRVFSISYNRIIFLLCLVGSHINTNKLYILITYILKKGVYIKCSLKFRALFNNSSNFEQGNFFEQFSSNFEQFYNIRAEHFRAEICENCSKLLENARIADFEHCSKSPNPYVYFNFLNLSRTSFIKII